MENLYLETENGNVPLQEEIIEKYHLRKGTKSPFTSNRIVGKNGEFFMEPDPEYYEYEELKSEGFHDDGIDQMDHGFEVSTSEMIDIAQGVDS
ncbi:hypothetical protein [Sinanaerobacter chloroacetimidivorans]|nr:hypothetical protein [Sinanaerobacter chloroacetimidivorans]